MSKHEEPAKPLAPEQFWRIYAEWAEVMYEPSPGDLRECAQVLTLVLAGKDSEAIDEMQRQTWGNAEGEDANRTECRRYCRELRAAAKKKP